MGWLSANANTEDILMSSDKYTTVVREEAIAQGYFITNTDKDGNKTTTFNQTSTVVIKCRVTTTTKTWERRGLTKAAAEKMVDDYNTTGALEAYVWTKSGCWVEVPSCVGTVYHASCRRASDGGNYTVTVTETNNEAVAA